MPTSHSHHNKLLLLKQNFSSGLVVFLVALPLCLGIALASGAPPLAGILSGIIGGVMIGSLSTSHISVSGPAAGLSAIIFAAIQELGSFELLLCAVFIAGGIQVLLGMLRAGTLTRYIPMAVIEGMLAGIGILIILSQLPYALGNKDSLRYILHLEIPELHLGSLIIALSSLIILLVWENQTLRQLKLLPAALAAVVISVIINELWQGTGSSLYISDIQRVNMPQIQKLDELKQLIHFPDLNGLLNISVWLTGFTIAIVASIETLLSIEAADRLDKQQRITHTNHELRVQGIGNITTALIGGLPMTSVIVRSSTNANAGATHKSSAVIHGLLLLVCAITIPHLLNKIPLASLAAVLIVIGYKLTRPAIYRHFWQKGLSYFLPFLITTFSVVSFDLLKGVTIGLIFHFLLHHLTARFAHKIKIHH